jgi:hypothetical protein
VTISGSFGASGLIIKPPKPKNLGPRVASAEC